MPTSDSASATAARPDFTAYGIETEWLRDAAAERRMLVAFAHPDDESFGPGRTLAHYAAAGVAIHYACATRGECGTVDPAHLAGYSSIADLRSAELRCAAEALGLAAVHQFGYRDSGMPGTPDNDNPAAFVQAPETRVIGQLVALIRTLRPQVVLTFNAYGGYGHPDHIMIHKATVAAFNAAGDRTCFTEQLEAGMEIWAPSKLYYDTFSPRMIKLGIAAMRIMRKDPSRVGTNADIDMVRAAAEVTPITTSVKALDSLEASERAAQCHKSQLSGTFPIRRLPAAIRQRIGASGHFTRVYPAWSAGKPIETDLFAGL